MRLPDGQIIMHGDRPYDPKKAHQYYEEHKKLKGRKKGKAEEPKGVSVDALKKKSVSAKQKAAYDKFLSGLPMAVEGAKPADVEKFVNGLRGKSDAQLMAEAAKITKQFGKKDGARVATIEKLLANRQRIRKADPSKLNAAERAPQRKAAAQAVTALRSKLADLNTQIKAHPDQKTHLSAQVESVRKSLSEAVTRQKALTPATKK